MPIDLKSGNAIANTVSQNLQSIDKTLDVANSGSDQATHLAAVQGAVLGNSDLVDSIGPNGQLALTSDFLNVTNDMLGTHAASGGNAKNFQADMAQLTRDLNNAGIQFDASSGQGHYDSSTLQRSAFVAPSSDNTQTSATHSVGDSAASSASSSASAGSSGAGSSSAGGTVLAQLNTIMSGVDTSPAALATSLPQMASEIRGVVAQNQLPAAQQAKLQKFADAVDAAVASYNPNNPQGSLKLIDTAVQTAFAKTGLLPSGGAGSSSSAANASAVPLSAQHALQQKGQGILTALDSAYTVIDDATPDTLKSSLSKFAGILTKMSADSSLPTDMQTKLKSYAAVVTQQAATIDPANFSATESAAKKAMDAEFLSLGFRQDAGLVASGQSETQTANTAGLLANFELSTVPLVQPFASKANITPEDAQNLYKQLESLVTSTPAQTAEVRSSMETALDKINQAASQYAAAGASSQGAQAFMQSVKSALSLNI